MQFNRSLTDDQYLLHLLLRHLSRKILNTSAVLIGLRIGFGFGFGMGMGIGEDKW